ncbi:PHD finger protein 3 [Mantella aurantiaca]
MDIVDTFNHLIPTEHLDDALFLGSNLESEGCDEFATGQHVIEDSLKNMLSDKDPMLGSASTQYCLPVLDNSEHNFQIPPSTGVGLDDIMDVVVDKITAVDINDEDDLILPDKNLNRLNEPSMKSLRKSPRLKAQESTRTLRPSTIEKTLNAVKTASPKKSKSSRKDTAVDKTKDKEHSLDIESDDKNNSTQNSRRSTRIVNKEYKDKMTTDQSSSNKETSDEESSTINDILSNTQSILEKEDGNSETLHNNSLILLNANSNKNLEVTEHDLTNSQGDHLTDNVLETPVDEKAYNNNNYQTDDKKADVIYDKVHQELALLSGVVECDLDVKTVLPPEINVECMLQNTVGSSVQECKPTKNSIASEIANTSNKCNSFGDISIVESLVQNCTEDLESGEKIQITEKEMSPGNEFEKVTRNRKVVKKLKPSSAKVPMSTENSLKNTSSSKDGNLYSHHQKGKMKKSNIIQCDSPVLPDKSKIIKVTKKGSLTSKIHSIPVKTAIKKKPHLAERKGNSSTLLKQLDDELRDSQESSKEASQVVSSHVRSRSLSYSSDKSATKPSFSKVAAHSKDVGEQKEATEHSEEKTKFKKSLPPRQRRSSKSASVDEPPLFIPDNIPTVKKEGAEVTSPTDKYVWNPTRHCSSCRKLHGNRFMVGCGRCDDWFHGECVGLSLGQAQQMEVDDKEYICVKCCVEEDKTDTSQTLASSDIQKQDLLQEQKTVEINKSVTTGCAGSPHEKSKQADDALKHKVKISKKNSGDNKQVLERKDLEMKKPASDRKTLQSPTASHRVSEEKRERSSKDSTAAPFNDEKAPKSGATEKQDIKKKKPEKRGSSSGLPNPSPSTPKPSVDQIRQSVRQSLKDILLKRLSESSSKIPEERANKVSGKIERELFSFYRDTDSKYKNKYRSLMFNLKDPKNNVLYKRVLRGDITPEHLIKMTPEELASKELAAWRQRENRHTIEMIEKEQREVERRPITKITHKGEIEIESEAPIKEPEAMDTEEPPVKTVEKEEEAHKDKEPPTESTSDTTAQHKNHLFDLNCKVCTGRMAPPAEDMSPKKAKMSLGAVHEESENISETSSASGNFKLDMLEPEKPESPKETFFAATSSEPFNVTETAEDESTFLSHLTCIWKGFLNMPSVAKFIIKAYPVSGSLDHLSEDLPESIQVGGRISPQTVWDYVEKIKASGTKETCVIRFCPETEEDQISYTLLYSYFSSRKRYGVVANNMRQVKDMYLIPLGASEKIPHFFVPFDGPGLETRRPNLLLALIIRQKVKRQHSTSLEDDQLGTLLSVPEKKSRNDVDEDDDEDDDENDFFNSFSAVLHKSRNRPPLSDNEEPQASVESVPEVVKREPPKPLRFLPGVLVGWENPQSTIDLANKPLPVDDILQSLLGTTENTFAHKPPVLTITDHTIKDGKKQLKDETIASETVLDKDIEMDITPNTVEEPKLNPTPVIQPQSGKLSLSLKDKPQDVPTEVYLGKINVWSSDEMVEKANSSEPADFNQDMDDTVHTSLSPVPENKNSTDDDITSYVDAIENPLKSSKLMHIKRDPRQAATRTHINSPDSKDCDMSKNKDDAIQDKELSESALRHKKDKTRKHSHEESDLLSSRNDRSKGSLSSSAKNEPEIAESSKTENSKQYPPDLLIDETDPLQQFRRALAANKSQSQALNASQTETSSKISIPTFTGNFSPLRLQQPPFLPLKGNPPPFPFQHTPTFPLQGNPIFSYPPHIPPLLPTPLGINFPRPPRFQSAEPGIHTSLVAWHPTLQIPRQAHFFGPVPSGPLLNSEQIRYQVPQKLYHKDRVQERRHSDPWDKQDRDRSFNRGSRSEHRQRFYSESQHSKEKRHDKESGSEKHGDRDSERSRRRDREKDRSHDRDRKSRDESHREKERSRASHSDKSSDSRTSKERKSSDKSKNEDRGHDKDKTRDRNKDQDDEKEKDRHHKDRSRDHNDKSKSKR